MSTDAALYELFCSGGKVNQERIDAEPDRNVKGALQMLMNKGGGMVYHPHFIANQIKLSVIKQDGYLVMGEDLTTMMMQRPIYDR